MEADGGGGFLWPLITVIGVIVLGLAIAYGTLHYRNRSTREQEEAVDRLYHEERE